MNTSVLKNVMFTLCSFLVTVGQCRAQQTADILEHVRPGVVTVLTADSKGKNTGLGSGFVVREDGVIVTAWHVVEGAASARIKLAGGRLFPVLGLLGKDKDKDFALLKIDTTSMPVIPVGDSDQMRQGDKVLTLGSPLGLEQSASEGIISAVRPRNKNGALLQITAAISPGNSGGPVLNMNGEAIGVALSRLKDGQSLNFALAVNEIKPVLNKVKEQDTRIEPLTEVIGRLGEVIQKTIIYRSRSNSSGHLTEAPTGTYVAVLESAGEWLGVLMADASVGWIIRSSVKLMEYQVVSAAPILTSAALKNEFVHEAYRFLGMPFKKGGTTDKGIDDVSLIQSVFVACGKAIPQTLKGQSDYGDPIKPDQLQPGDRLYFGDWENMVPEEDTEFLAVKRRIVLSMSVINHTGLYIGNGYFIHASLSQHGVVINRLAEPVYARLFVCARR